jgi:hypothetical protein
MVVSGFIDIYPGELPVPCQPGVGPLLPAY